MFMLSYLKLAIPSPISISLSIPVSKSFPVITAKTPDIFSASEVSIEIIFA